MLKKGPGGRNLLADDKGKYKQLTELIPPSPYYRICAPGGGLAGQIRSGLAGERNLSPSFPSYTWERHIGQS
jgi:hypothetical protein